MINTKLKQTATNQSTEEKFTKLLESIDWKLWEIMNMMKDQIAEKSTPAPATKKKTEK